MQQSNETMSVRPDERIYLDVSTQNELNDGVETAVDEILEPCMNAEADRIPDTSSTS